MTITTEQLRSKPGSIFSLVNSGNEVIVSYRGKKCVKIVSIRENSEAPDDFLGMWKDRNDMKDVEQFVRNLRKNRKLC
jgi:antitoxin (DNA-binding transcriptional repressor) of toxin-antitoxin stability system